MGPGDALKAALDFRFGTMTGVDDSNRQGFCDDVATTIGGQSPLTIVGQSGSVPLSDLATSVEVVFAHGEPDNQYFPLLSQGTLAGHPTFSIPHWSWEDINAEGFVIHVATPPGLGNTILIAWVIFRLTV